MSQIPIEKEGNSYINDTESGAEMARLLNQDQTLTDAMGGSLPELGSDIEEMKDVLDLACGPGGWAQELAFAYPHLNVTGGDISQAMIRFARMQAQVRLLQNANFFVRDVTKPLEMFPDNSFDLINGRTMAGFMKRESWPNLVKECA